MGHGTWDIGSLSRNGTLHVPSSREINTTFNVDLTVLYLLAPSPM